MEKNKAMLEVTNLGISFGGLRAVDELSMKIDKGSLVGLIGPNGAGKTTVFNMLTGVYRPTDGGIRLDGQNLVGKKMLHLGSYRKKEKQMDEEALRILSLFGLDSSAKDLASNLPYGKQRKLEIARALATDPKLLLLDEPAAGMNPNETRELMETISLVRKEYGVTILLIEHDMKLVQGICEYLYVLNFGRLLTEGEPKDVLNNPEVITAYLGD